jgi:membrane associated rhomboid family serine protease
MIPLPISDENPRLKFPAATLAFIAANLVAWFYEIGHGVELATLDYGLIPGFLLQGTRDGVIRLPGGVIELHQEVPVHLTPLTSMFMHGSWAHILGNMWFLWIFGDNVEDAMGKLRFVVFYLLCGLAAAFAQIATNPHSTIPMVGASGAIAGVLGGYLLLFPHARVRCLWVLFIFIQFVYLPAWLLLGLWFISQFFIPMGSGVAWMAHVGGFVAGLVLVKLFARRAPPRRPQIAYYN